MKLIALSVIAVLVATPAAAKCGWFSGPTCKQHELEGQLAKVKQRCDALSASGQHKTHVEHARCMNDGEEKYVLPLVPRDDRDLLHLRESYRISLAKKVDDNQLSLEDAELQFAQVTTQIVSEGQRRNEQRGQSDFQRQQIFLRLYQMLNPAPPPQVNCNTNYFGNTAHTTCY